MSAALGYPDFQRITQWFGSPLAQADAYAIGAGQLVLGPLDVRSFASVVVCVKPTGGTVTVTVTQLVPGGPAALATSSSFVVNAGNVVFEAFVLLAGEVQVTFQGSAPGETIAYAIVPANTNVNAEVAALTQLGFQHNDAVVATETAIDLEDAAPIGWTFVDDPANLRMKITPTLRQNGAATGSLYRWDGGAWTPTAGVIVDDTARKITLGGDTTLYRSAASLLRTDGSLAVGSTLGTTGPTAGNPVTGVFIGSGGSVNVVKTGLANPAFTAFLSGDTAAWRHTIGADGLTQWGDGTNPIDLTMYRYAAAWIGITDNIVLPNNVDHALSFLDNTFGYGGIRRLAASGNVEVAAQVNLVLRPNAAGGKVYIEDSGAVADTGLYRSGAATLATDSNVKIFLASADANPQIWLVRNMGGAGLPGIMLGPGGASSVDVNLYRAAGGTLKTDGIFIAGSQIYAQTAGGGTGFVYNPAAAGGIAFQSIVVGEANARVNMDSNGKVNLGAGGASATDTTLYRAAAKTLQTDGWLVTNGAGANAVYVGTLDGGTTAAAGLRFGSDTQLYRTAAGVVGYGPVTDVKTVQRHATAGLRHMESGIVNVAGSSTATVTFAKPFSSVPNVVVSTNGGNGKSPYISTVSATQVVLGNFDTTTQNLFWIADGPD